MDELVTRFGWNLVLCTPFGILVWCLTRAPKIRVRPAAHLDRLEEVLVLQTRQELNMKKAPDAETAPVASPSASRVAIAPVAPPKKPANITNTAKPASTTNTTDTAKPANTTNTTDTPKPANVINTTDTTSTTSPN